MKYFNPFIIVAFLLVVAACASEPKAVIEASQLVGRWEIEQATRAGKPTATLDQLFFVFSEDGTMETNLPTFEGQSAYKLNDNIVRQDGATEAKYTIESLNESQLILTTELRGFEFRFLLNRATIQDK